MPAGPLPAEGPSVIGVRGAGLPRSDREEGGGAWPAPLTQSSLRLVLQKVATFVVNVCRTAASLA